MLSQDFKRIKPRGMAVAPGNVEGVVAGGANGDRMDIVRDATVIEHLFTAPLIDTGRATAGPAEVCAVVTADVAVLPVDGEVGSRELFEFGGFHINLSS